MDKAKELAGEVIKNINSIDKNYNIMPSNNLEEVIINNIKIMEETIKCLIFFDNLSKNLFTNFCINSIKHKYYNLLIFILK